MTNQPAPRSDFARQRRWAGVAGVIGFVVAVGMGIKGSERPTLYWHSVASLAAASSGLVLTIVGAVMVVASDSAWRRWVGIAQRWEKAPVGQWSTTKTLVGVTGAIVVFMLLASRSCRQNSAPDHDELHYLEVAQSIHDDGGIVGLFRGLWTGSFTEANRHPFYLVLLVLHPTFTAGKCWSLIGGLLTLITTAWIAWRRLGGRSATIVAVLLAGNAALIESATLVACETWLCWLVLLTWIVLTTQPMTNRSIVTAGILLGAGYLTKGSALFLWPITLIWLAVRAPTWRTATQAVVLYSVGLLVCASPLLIRNVQAFGQPFYSFNNRFLFAETYDAGMTQPDLGTEENAWRYFERNPILTVLWERTVGGLVTETLIVLRTLGPTPLENARAIVGLLLLVLAIALGLVRARSFWRNDVGLALGWTVVFWAFFGWYSPIAAGDRFIVPLAPILLLLAAEALDRAVSAWQSRISDHL